MFNSSTEPTAVWTVVLRAWRPSKTIRWVSCWTPSACRSELWLDQDRSRACAECPRSHQSASFSRSGATEFPESAAITQPQPHHSELRQSRDPRQAGRRPRSLRNYLGRGESRLHVADLFVLRLCGQEKSPITEWPAWGFLCQLN